MCYMYTVHVHVYSNTIYLLKGISFHGLHQPLYPPNPPPLQLHVHVHTSLQVCTCMLTRMSRYMYMYMYNPTNLQCTFLHTFILIIDILVLSNLGLTFEFSFNFYVTIKPFLDNFLFIVSVLRYFRFHTINPFRSIR